MMPVRVEQNHSTTEPVPLYHTLLSPDKVGGIYIWRPPSVHSVRPCVLLSVHTFCLSGTISQYLLVRFVCGEYTVFMLSVCACVCQSVTFCFLNNLKSHCWIFIKPCKHVHICKTNTLDKIVRDRGQSLCSSKWLLI